MSLFGDIGNSLSGLFGGQQPGGYDLAARAANARMIGGDMSRDDFEAWRKRREEEKARQGGDLMKQLLEVGQTIPGGLQSLFGG